MNGKRITRENVQKKKKKILKVFFCIIIFIVLMISALIANEYIILDKNKTMNLVINNKNVTSNLKKDIIIEDDIIYLSKQDIGNFFDKYIYEDPENNQIVTTYNNKIATIGFENNVININNSQKNIYAHAIKANDTIYLPISEMKDVYGIEIDKIDSTKVITMDSIENEQKKATVAKNSSIKSSTKFISKTVDRVEKGSYVVVISETENGYTRVRTENGKIGYIKSNKLTNQITVREDIEEKKQIEGKVNLVWDYFSEVASAPDRSNTSIDGVNVVSPSFFYIDENGEYNENVGQAGENYINWAHSNGYKVWPMVSNAGEGMLSVTSEIMNSFNKRQELIENIVNSCIKYDLDGINIDFENMKKEDIDLYSRFIIELTPRLKEIGMVTSVDVTAPDGSETWSQCFDRHVIGDVADYIIFMAYDEYGASSNKSGTTAGFDWIELGVIKFIETEEIETEKIILGIPFYTRVWTEDSEGKVISNPAIPMNRIDSNIPEGIEKQWDDKLKQNYVEFENNGNIKKIWIEDLESIKEKLSLISKYKLGGVASWEKDMEDQNVWQLIKELLQI